MADNQLQSLAQIFNQKFFRIPDYQRGYSWGNRELEDFREDLENIKDNRFHYTGLLTVEKLKRELVEKQERWTEDIWMFEKGFSAYYIIDGQQRLTTSMILINELLGKFNDDEGVNFQNKKSRVEKFLYQRYEQFNSFLFGYEKDNPSNEYFKDKILGQKSYEPVAEQTLYTKNLQNAKDFFSTRISGMVKEEQEVLFRKVVNNLKFNFYEISDDLDVFVTFETMNNRGKPLSKLELLKNRLIYLSTLIEGSDNSKNSLRKLINDTRKTVYEYLGKNSENVLEDDEFLFNHWIMYFKYERKEGQEYAKFLLNEYFTAKNVLGSGKYKIGLENIKEYVESISVSVKKWFFILNPSFSTYGNLVKENLEKLNRVGFGAFKPLILAFLCKEINEEDTRRFLENAEKFVFLIFKVTKRLSTTENSYLYRLANKFYFDKPDENYSGEVWTVDEIIKHILWLTYGDEDKTVEDYNTGHFDIQKFILHIDDLFNKGNGFYSWDGLRYFLYEYETYLQEADKKQGRKISWEEASRPKSIEHIYPQTADNEYWTSIFKGLSEKQSFLLKNSLGNLLLLRGGDNSKASNNGFDEKKEIYYNGSFSEIEVSQNNDWTPELIKQRGIELLEFLEKRWNITIGDKETKLKILHLDFVK
ncbi:MAG: DUF262 domain-containing protein [Candidatus Absconditabacteria bacterium]